MRGQGNFYRTLQVDPAAEDIVIQAAYRALMKQYHPDHGGDAAYAQQLNAAYATLADPIAREAYDRLIYRQREARRRSSVDRQRRSPRAVRSLIDALGGDVFYRFLPDFQEGLVGVFDFAGVLREAPRHRLWLKRAWRGDATEARAFAAAVEAARLSRPLWAWGSDLFVAVLPTVTGEFRWLLRGPTGPVARLSYAVAVYDLGTREISAVGRSSELPTFRPFVLAIAAGRPSATARAAG